MNIGNLKAGLVVKNYPALCELLEEKVKRGNSRDAHIKEIKRFVRLEKKGHRFIVKEIYKTPKIKKSNNVYGGLVQLLLTDYFMKENKNYIEANKTYLLQRVKMINENYKENRNDMTTYAKRNSLDEVATFDFYDTTSSTFGNVIETALKNLQNQALILYNEVYMVQPSGTNLHRRATRKERDIALATRNKLLKEFNYSNIQRILHSTDRNRYLKEFNEITHEKAGISRFYKGYEINILQDSIAEKQKKNILSYLSDAQKEGYEDQLNQLVISRLLENAERRHNKAKQGFGTKSKKLEARKSDVYIDSMKVMIDENIISTSRIVSNDKKSKLKSGKDIDEVMETFFKCEKE